jgi:tRNA C32,U32 (ribose-2'-O)-methylase TrmJ
VAAAWPWSSALKKHGLTREDLSYCHILVEIPTDPLQPSMNLGQAVAVCLYELTRTRRIRTGNRVCNSYHFLCPPSGPP